MIKERRSRVAPYGRRPSSRDKKRASEEEEESATSYIGMFKGLLQTLFQNSNETK